MLQYKIRLYVTVAGQRKLYNEYVFYTVKQLHIICTEILSFIDDGLFPEYYITLLCQDGEAMSVSALDLHADKILRIISDHYARGNFLYIKFNTSVWQSYCLACAKSITDAKEALNNVQWTFKDIFTDVDSATVYLGDKCLQVFKLSSDR